MGIGNWEYLELGFQCQQITCKKHDFGFWLFLFPFSSKLKWTSRFRLVILQAIRIRREERGKEALTVLAAKAVRLASSLVSSGPMACIAVPQYSHSSGPGREGAGGVGWFSPKARRNPRPECIYPPTARRNIGCGA